MRMPLSDYDHKYLDSWMYHILAMVCKKLTYKSDQDLHNKCVTLLIVRPSLIEGE